jgi:hypothetical protein
MTFDYAYMSAWRSAESSNDGSSLADHYDRSFVPGVDFDPYDREEVELVKMVGEQDRLDTQAREIERQGREVGRLRALLDEHGIEHEEE